MRPFVLAPGAKLFMCVYSLLALPNALQRQGGQHMQLVADMALHRSYCVVSSAAATQIESVMTKVTSLSH